MSTKNIITFSARKVFLDEEQKFIQPSPGIKELPEWFKNLNPYINKSHKSMTIKKCVPFLDALSAGYILKCPLDLNFIEEDNDYRWIHKGNRMPSEMHINMNDSLKGQFHPKEQVGGDTCPLVGENNNRHNFFKILNPFNIHTPKGYSCLFTPPLNKPNKDFEIISGIVDTDTQHIVNFPIIIKSKAKQFTIKKGDAYAQVMPFKRDNWEMNIKEHSEEDDKNYDLIYSSVIENFYRKFKHTVKKWI